MSIRWRKDLPSATQLTIAYQSRGPAGLPPGTLNTLIEMIHYNTNLRRKNGRIEQGPRERLTRQVDFGQGPVETVMLTWGDVFMAYHSTGIPHIEDYAALPKALVRQMRFTERLQRSFYAGFHVTRRLSSIHFMHVCYGGYPESILPS
ncbi:hypothetical protein ACFLXI_05025 [Chloroflexota bacterium]